MLRNANSPNAPKYANNKQIGYNFNASHVMNLIAVVFINIG